MSIESNKVLARSFFQTIGDRDLDALSELLHDDGSWTIPYRPDLFPFAGVKNKSAALEMLRGFLGSFTEFQFAIINITAEADRVAVEARSAGKGARGVAYENVYHMHLVIKDGKVHSIREMFDPYQVMAYVEKIS